MYLAFPALALNARNLRGMQHPGYVVKYRLVVGGLLRVVDADDFRELVVKLDGGRHGGTWRLEGD